MSSTLYKTPVLICCVPDYPSASLTRFSLLLLQAYLHISPQSSQFTFVPLDSHLHAVPFHEALSMVSGDLVITFTKVSSHPLDTSRHMSTQPASAAPTPHLPLMYVYTGHPVVATSLVTVSTSRSRSHDCNDFAAPSTPPPAPAVPRPRHLDLAATPSTLPTRLQPPPRPRHAAATSTRPPLPTRPRYNASTSAVYLDPHRHRLSIAPTATSTPLRRFHQRRVPRPAPAPSRHTPHCHLDPATTLPPAPRTLTRTSIVPTQPPPPSRRWRRPPVHPVSTPPHRIGTVSIPHYL
ncbi:hypothetical protein EDB85DRAFT_2292544 [Lactarius pseudohatsudake]|nr:hypothetical protein EDB85DRAFT_2292544 [Lactarius pseudohatsudake]